MSVQPTITIRACRKCGAKFQPGSKWVLHQRGGKPCGPVEDVTYTLLSAAEKERNGIKLPATQEGREGETCSTIDHETIPAVRYVSCEGEGRHPYCAECVRVLLRAGEIDHGPVKGREGDIIEKLRAELARKRRDLVGYTGGEYMAGYVDGSDDVIGELLPFLDRLQEQSTGGEG